MQGVYIIYIILGEKGIKNQKKAFFYKNFLHLCYTLDWRSLMFKKLSAVLAAFAVFTLFSCSSDEPPEGGSSSPSGGGNSSSSTVSAVPVTAYIASFNNAKSIFDTYGYGYTLKAGEAEDLTQFWDVNEECPIGEQTTVPPATCELDKANAILQNTLTNQYADLHYKVDGVRLDWPNEGLELKQYKLSEGDQAALGLDVGEAPKDIRLINGLTEFVYRYWGGAHAFRVLTSNEEDFWFVQVRASTTDTVDVTILPSEFEGTGSLEGSPLDLSQAKKFLWVVEYTEGASNTGTLLIDYLKWTKLN
jgi:hypothetical protein